MEKLLKEEKFGFVTDKNKEFIVELTKHKNYFGYNFDGKIGDGFDGGHYMIIY
jgi:hypothetical protein